MIANYLQPSFNGKHLQPQKRHDFCVAQLVGSSRTLGSIFQNWANVDAMAPNRSSLPKIQWLPLFSTYIFWALK